MSCLSCRHFSDNFDPEDDPDEVDGYCCELVDRLGLLEALKINGYGGHFTHSRSWCSSWELDDGTNGWQPKRAGWQAVAKDSAGSLLESKPNGGGVETPDPTPQSTS